LFLAQHEGHRRRSFRSFQT